MQRKKKSSWHILCATCEISQGNVCFSACHISSQKGTTQSIEHLFPRETRKNSMCGSLVADLLCRNVVVVSPMARATSDPVLRKIGITLLPSGGTRSQRRSILWHGRRLSKIIVKIEHARATWLHVEFPDIDALRSQIRRRAIRGLRLLRGRSSATGAVPVIAC